MSRPFDTLIAFLKEFFEEVHFENVTTKARKYKNIHKAKPFGQKLTWSLIETTKARKYKNIGKAKPFGQTLTWSLIDSTLSCSENTTCTIKPVLSCHPKRRPKMCFRDRLSLNAGQKYCRMLQGEHFALLSTFIRLPFVIKIFLFCLFFLSGLTVL